MVGRAWVLLACGFLLTIPTSALSGWIPKWVWKGTKNFGWGERDYEGMIDEMKIFYQEQSWKKVGTLESSYWSIFGQNSERKAEFGK